MCQGSFFIGNLLRSFFARNGWSGIVSDYTFFGQILGDLAAQSVGVVPVERQLISVFSPCSCSGHVDPSEHFLAWNNAALNVLVIKKVMDPEVTKCFKELTQWLVEVNRSNCMV